MLSNQYSSNSAKLYSAVYKSHKVLTILDVEALMRFIIHFALNNLYDSNSAKLYSAVYKSHKVLTILDVEALVRFI
ncbi:MAG: hypothetical protein K0R84_1190, partial [Clostridia bacterium]|nr:hypothetical protein [Clostridia bacterium]